VAGDAHGGMMGLRNPPSIHQRWVIAALCPFIGKICHVYLGDMIIWSNMLDSAGRTHETYENSIESTTDCKTVLQPKEIPFLSSREEATGTTIQTPVQIA
jgi:hypothetical protein